jgi:phosphoglycolate phosphatase-like HAD superfamily hydrolase
MKLALFDIDGTLLLSQGLGRAAKAHAMREVFGTEANVQTHPFGGKTDWQILNELLGPLGWTSEAIGARMADYETRFARHMRDLASDFTATPLPGALELVQALDARPDVLVGVVTGNTRETAPVKLRAGGFDPSLFRVGAFGSESHNRNDLPALAIQRAEALIGATIRPSEVFVIGDTVADVTCARAVGAVAVAVLTGFEERELLLASQPDYVLNDLREFDRVPL